MRMRSALGSFSGRAKLSWIFRSALGRGLANVPLAAAMEFESGEGAERGSLNGLSVTPTAGTHITCSCGCALACSGFFFFLRVIFLPLETLRDPSY